MRTWHTGIAVATLAGLVACRYQPSPVPLRGTAQDIAALAGQWEGEFSSEQSGRSGTLWFTIRPGVDTAFGDVTMIPEGGQALVAADAATQAHVMHSRAPELLRVTFVNVSGGAVEGALEPYIAPDCRCVVTTVFRGYVHGALMDGRYETRGEQGLRQEGRWRLERRRLLGSAVREQPAAQSLDAHPAAAQPF